MGLGLSSEYATVVVRGGSLLMLLVLAVILQYVAKTVVRRLFAAWVKRTKNTWDDLIFERKLVSRIAQIVPAIVIAIIAPILFQHDDGAIRLVDKAIVVYVIIIVVLLFDSLLNLGMDLYGRTEASKRLHLKGFFQAAKLIVILIAVIMVIAEIIGESPVTTRTRFSSSGASVRISSSS